MWCVDTSRFAPADFAAARLVSAALLASGVVPSARPAGSSCASTRLARVDGALDEWTKVWRPVPFRAPVRDVGVI